MEFRFADPWWLLALIPVLLVLLHHPKRGGAGFGPFALAAGLRPSRGPLLFRILTALGLACLVVAMARPQYGKTVREFDQTGRDLVLVIDLSLSMQVDDIADETGDRIDRLAAVMNAAHRFIEGRETDRIALVFFAEQALTSCPLTYDHSMVHDFLDRTETQQRDLWRRNDNLLGKGTNLGLGLGIALKRLDEKTALDRLGRAIILITDGRDTLELDNWVDPIEAARHADELDIRIHGIGVGNPGGTMTDGSGILGIRQRRTPTHLLPDMSRLRAICNRAGGEALTAGDEQGLQEVFARIDQLEPSPRSMRTRDLYTDRYRLFLAIGLALLTLGLVGEPRLRGSLS